MKYIISLLLLTLSTSSCLFAHIFEINFDSGLPNPINISGCTTGDSNNYFGDLNEASINHNFTNDTGDFLAAQNTMDMSCASNSCIKSLNYNQVLPGGGVSGLKVCFDVAVGGASGWDTDAKLMVTLTGDGSIPRYIQFSGGNSDGDQPGLDTFCDGVADGYESGGANPTYPRTNTFQTFCFELAESGFITDIDVNVHFIGFDRPGENVAVDNIITYYDFSSNGGVDTDFPNIPLTPYCLLDCPLLTDVCDVYCDAVTSGNDNYSVEMAYVGGDQGAGTYNISGTFTGPHPNSNYYDLLVFSESEINNLNINISDASNCSIQESILAPNCVVPTCTPSNSGTNAPSVIVQSESTCQADLVTQSGGVLTAPTSNCPVGSTLEYSTNGGSTWSTTLPVYNQYNTLTIQTRCVCDIDPNDLSNESSVTTNPGTCPATCVPVLTGTNAPSVIIQNESTCQSDLVTQSGGSLSAPASNCPSGSTLEYSTNGGSSWSTNLPAYDQYNSVTVQTRCICDIDPSNLSNTSTVTTTPGTCPTTCSPPLTGTNPPLIVILNESTCQTDNVTLSGGSFAASTFLCPANSTLEYSVDGGSSWSTNLPVYDQYNQMSVKTRCSCDIDPTNVSNISTINTSPGSCPTCTTINVSAQATCSSSISSNQFYITVNSLSGGDATSSGSIYTFDDGTNVYTVDGSSLPMDIGPFNFTGVGNINFTIYDNDDLTCTTTLSVAQFNCTTVSILNIKAYLAGPYRTGGTMATNLINDGEIPAQHPYTVSPYNAPAFATSSFPANMVDYILIEARTTLSNTAVIQKIGILLDDGTIIDTNGGSIQMNLNAASSYYIWVRHRNHLDVVIASPMAPSNNMNIDFTTSMNSAYGPQQLEVTSDGKFSLHTGDFDRNGVINNGDFDQWKLSPAILGGYHYTDSNLDATVQVTDFDRWYYNRSLIGAAQLGL